MARGRKEEGFALVQHALRLGVDAGIASATLRAYFNLANLSHDHDRYDAALEYSREGLALARRLGDRSWEWSLVANIVVTLFLRSEWEEALAHAREVPHFGALEATEEFTGVRFAAVELLLTIPQLRLARGQVAEADQVLQQYAPFRDSADVQERTTYGAARCAVLRHHGRLDEALASGLAAFEGRAGVGGSSHYVKFALVEAVETAFELGDLERVDGLLEITGAFGVATMTPLVEAQATRFGARLAALRGDADGADESFGAAVGRMRRIDVPFWLAVTLLEYGEWRVETGRADEADDLLGEAVGLFARLEATPWHARAARAREALGATVGVRPSPAAAAAGP